MLLFRKPLHVGFISLLFCWAATPTQLVLAGTPYTAIHERNLFRLRPPATIRAEPKQAPVPRVHLTGITTILRGKRALLKVEFPAKPAERPKEESYILTEGQRAGPIEVLEINEKTAQVKVDNSGIVTNITFEKILPRPPVATTPPLPQVYSRWRTLPYRAVSP